MAMLSRLFTFMLLTVILMHRLIVKTRADNQPLVDAVQSVSKLMDHFKKNYQSVSFTEHLGMRVVEGQLKLLLLEYERGHHRTVPANIMSQIRAIVEEASKSANMAVPHLMDRDPNYLQLTHYQVRNPWLMFHPHRLVDSNALNYPYVPGPSSEIMESDRNKCIFELTGNDSDASKCHVTETCLKLMVSPDHHGYSLQHQIYYVAFAERVGCVKVVNEYLKTMTSMETVAELQKYYCSTVYYELLHIVSLYGIQPSYKELFLLTQFICPNMGFFEFLNKDWLTLILSWQTSTGCFVLQNKQDSLLVQKQQKQFSDTQKQIVPAAGNNYVEFNDHDAQDNLNSQSARQQNSRNQKNPTIQLVKEIPFQNLPQHLDNLQQSKQNPVVVRAYGQPSHHLDSNQPDQQHVVEHLQNQVGNMQQLGNNYNQKVLANKVYYDNGNFYQSNQQEGGQQQNNNNFQSNYAVQVPAHVAEWMANQHNMHTQHNMHNQYNVHNQPNNQNNLQKLVHYKMPRSNDYYNLLQQQNRLQDSYPHLHYKPLQRIPLNTDTSADYEVAYDGNNKVNSRHAVNEIVNANIDKDKSAEAWNKDYNLLYDSEHKQPNAPLNRVHSANQILNSKQLVQKLGIQLNSDEHLETINNKFNLRKWQQYLTEKTIAPPHEKLKREAYSNEWFPNEPLHVHEDDYEQKNYYEGFDRNPKQRRLLFKDNTVLDNDHLVDRDRHIGNATEKPIYMYYYPIYDQMKQMNKAKERAKLNAEKRKSKAAAVRKVVKQKQEGECHSQITGLAACALAMYIRFLIDPGPSEFHKMRLNRPADEADVQIVDHASDDGDAEDDAQPVYKSANVYFKEHHPAVGSQLTDHPLSHAKAYVPSRFADPLYVGEARKKLHPEENVDYVRKADQQKELVDKALSKMGEREEKRTLLKPVDVPSTDELIETSDRKKSAKSSYADGVRVHLGSLFSGQRMADLHQRIQDDLGYHLIIIVVISFLCMLLLYKYLRYKRYLLRHRTKAT